MKRILALILALALCFALCACAKKQENETADDTKNENVSTKAGGWTIPDEFAEVNDPKDALDALNEALEGLTGAGYVPVAYLGSQIVAGENFAFLCKETLVTAEPVVKLSVVKVFRDLDGSVKLLSADEINVADYNQAGDIEFAPGNIAGGWSVNTGYAGTLDETVQAAYDKAMEKVLGVGYTPLACIGTQVVAGINYAVLCSATTVTAEPESALAVVVIYADLQGEATVNSITGFDF